MGIPIEFMEKPMTVLRRSTLFSFILILLSAGVSACSTSDSPDHVYSMASLDGMPAKVQSAPATVRQAYQFAVANPDLLKQIPCYCGCGAVGHTSNYDCYVADVDLQGTIAYDAHALGCTICVDITQDMMRLLDKGQSASEIRSYVDQTYARYGPSNMP